jgi:hypothetical protein
MPPRKSNVSIGSNGAEEGAEGTSSKAPKDGMSVEVCAIDIIPIHDLTVLSRT